MGKQPSKPISDGNSPAAKAIIFLIRIYQVVISPWLGPACRHVPTCSSYMMEAVREWGALQGSWMGIKRLSRCHPWGTSGYDPVPAKKEQSCTE